MVKKVVSKKIIAYYVMYRLSWITFVMFNKRKKSKVSGELQ